MKVNPNKPIRYAGLALMFVGLTHVVLGILLITGLLHP